MTYWLSPEQIELAKHPERFHKDPKAYIAEVVGIIERNTKCKKCGEKAIEVVSYEEKHLRCKNCGHEKKAEKDEE
jgi:formylmethanofuran dehydrogenase subunit E